LRSAMTPAKALEAKTVERTMIADEKYILVLIEDNKEGLVVGLLK